MHVIYRYQILILVSIFACLPALSHAQSGNYNYLDFQNKPYYFGITLGLNRADYKLYFAESFIRNDSIRVAESLQGPGFNLGIVTNLKIGQYFDFRFLPTLSFAERNIQYSSPKDSRLPYTRKLESVFVELPFHIRLKSAPYNDKKFFLIAGVKYAFDVASDSRTRQSDELIKISPTDFQVEYGAGVQLFFPYFIFSPEFKISHGMNNVLIYNDKLNQSAIIEKVLSRAFTLSLHFEG